MPYVAFRSSAEYSGVNAFGWIPPRSGSIPADRSTKRTKATGKGSRETKIGLETEDSRDQLDRRVEFKVMDCP